MFLKRLIFLLLLPFYSALQLYTDFDSLPDYAYLGEWLPLGYADQYIVYNGHTEEVIGVLLAERPLFRGPPRIYCPNKAFEDVDVVDDDEEDITHCHNLWFPQDFALE